MKKYTQSEFDAFKIINGVRECPTGDYSNVCSFGDQCRFGDQCHFGKSCHFGESCRFENISTYIGKYPYLKFGGFGSRTGSEVYFFNLDKGIFVRCGCFLGSMETFKQRVINENADPSYMDLCEIVLKKLNPCREDNSAQK